VVRAYWSVTARLRPGANWPTQYCGSPVCLVLFRVVRGSVLANKTIHELHETHVGTVLEAKRVRLECDLVASFNG
jgi:hypothetical protein